MRRGKIVQPEVADTTPSAKQQWRAVDQQSVDLIGSKQPGSNPCPTLDEYSQDLGHRIDVADIAKQQRTCQTPIWRYRRQTAAEHRRSRSSVLESLASHVERRIIDVERTPADDNHVAARPFEMGVSPRLSAGDPSAGTIVKCEAAIERQRQLERYQRLPMLLTIEETGVDPDRFGGKNAGGDLDASGAQLFNTAACRALVGVGDRDDDPGDPRRDQQIGAGRATWRLVCARFEGDVSGSTTRRVSGLLERDRLGVGSSARLRPTATYDAINM